jgi:hypothetical protein
MNKSPDIFYKPAKTISQKKTSGLYGNAPISAAMPQKKAPY